ncbi:hypothetical protein TcasGA2_TC013257 [Tribolium castaneum]|uniref:Uncharacterized protein n=1 Tax=Tribolium castaneum TaxID=7070 RepID=D6WME5_TRICA|nr:hypothetical protein TcasGA2_TC013257 [Tribolium castaneum]
MARRNPRLLHRTQTNSTDIVTVLNLLLGGVPELPQNRLLLPQNLQAVRHHVLESQIHRQVEGDEREPDLAVEAQQEHQNGRDTHGVVAQNHRGVERLQGLQVLQPQEDQERREQLDEDPLGAHVVGPGDERVQGRGLVVLQALLQAEDEQHEGDGDDERYGFGPFEHDFGGGHRHVLDVAVLGHVDGHRPVLLLDQLLDVRHAIGDHVVKHEGVQPGDPLLGAVAAPEGAQQHAVAHHEEHQLEEDSSSVFFWRN